MNNTDRRTYWTKTERMRIKLERKFAPQVKKALDDQAAAAVLAIEAGGIQAVNSLPVELWDQQLLGVYSRMFSESFFTFANATYNSLKNTKQTPGMGRADGWTLYVQDWLRENGLKMVVTITGTSRELYISIANKAIQDGIDQGLGARDIQTLITSRLKDVGYTYSGSRALRIARTETVRGANEGHMKGAEALPFFVNKVWISAKDARTRRVPDDTFDHWLLDGAKIDYEQPFVSYSKFGAEVQAMMPGDVTAPAGFTINCRCRVAFEGKRGKDGRLLMKPAAGSSPTVTPSTPPVILTPIGGPAPAAPEKFTPGKNKKETAQKLVDYIKQKAGFKAASWSKVSKNLTEEDFNSYAEKAASLFDEYNIEPGVVAASSPVFTFERSQRHYGVVENISQPTNRMLSTLKITKINFGDRCDLISREYDYEPGEMKFRNKSAVDITPKLSTVVHEFAHIISQQDYTTLPGIRQETITFWSEMEEIKKAYIKEIQDIRHLVNKASVAGPENDAEVLRLQKRYYDTHLGAYANTNMNEFMAEGFTEYKLKKDPSKYALQIGQLIDKNFKRKK